MPDDIDVATEQYSEWFENRLANVRREAAEKQLSPNGKCYYCFEPVPDGVTFCVDDDCAEDYDYRLKLKNRNGDTNA